MDDQFITVKTVCPDCQNLNRQWRRACGRCNHTGYLADKKVKNEPGKPLNFGGIPTKPIPDDARSLQRSAP
jgi:hypothetical protein